MADHGWFRHIRRWSGRTEFVLHGHNDFYVVQWVQTQVVDEVRVDSQLKTPNEHNIIGKAQQTNELHASALVS